MNRGYKLRQPRKIGSFCLADWSPRIRGGVGRQRESPCRARCSPPVFDSVFPDGMWRIWHASPITTPGYATTVFPPSQADVSAATHVARTRACTDVGLWRQSCGRTGAANDAEGWRKREHGGRAIEA